MKSETRQPRLSQRLRSLRKKLIVASWEEYKSEYTMVELAQVFRMQISQFYDIVSKNAKETEKKQQNQI